MLNRAAGPASQCAYQCLLIRCEPTERWAAVVLLVGQRAASVEEFVFLHDVQAYRQTRCQNSRCKFGAPLSWAGSLSGIGRLAAQPPLRESRAESVSTPRFGRLRIAGVCWRNPKRGLEEREPFAGWFHFCGAACNRSLSNLADLSLKSAPARASAAFGLFSRLAPRVRWLASASSGSGAPERQLPG